MFKYLSAGSFIAPAERSAINIFSKELSLIKNRLFEGLLKANGKTHKMLDLLKTRVNRYSRPIRDNLEIAEDLAALSKKASPYRHLAEELEQRILKGKINVSPEGEVKYIPDQAENVNLEVHLTGSLVKALSNIVFYLRHLGDFKEFQVRYRALIFSGSNTRRFSTNVRHEPYLQYQGGLKFKHLKCGEDCSLHVHCDE